MALSNYKRAYTLTIEDAIEIEDLEGKRLQESFPNVIKDGDLSAFEIKRTVITDLHIEATIQAEGKTSASDETSSEIKIFNLSQETRDRISKVNAKVILEAGYEELQRVIFTGQVIDAYTIKNGEDVITTLICKDGWSPNTAVRFVKAYSRNQSYLQIFNDIIKTYNENGIARATNGIILDQITHPLKETADKAILQKGWVHTGFLKDALKKLCDEFLLTSQIVNSKLYIYPKNYAKMFSQVEVNNNNILSIRRRQDGTEKTPNKPVLSGIEVTMLLDGRIDLTTRLKITNINQGSTAGSLQDFTGDYRVMGIRHKLDYEGNSWYTILECKGVDE